MQSFSPAPTGRAAGRGATIDQHHGSTGESDGPALTIRADATRVEIASKVRERVLADPLDDAIGEPAFGDTAEVDAVSGCHASALVAQGEDRPERWHRRGRRRRRDRWALRERPRVSDG